MSLRVTAWAFDQRLPFPEKWLLVCLGDYADDWGDSIFPAFETLEIKTGMPRSTLKRTLQTLLELGLVVRTARHTPYSPNFYRIVLPEPEHAQRPKQASCPLPLRRAVICAFNGRCESCGRHGLRELREIGPDGQPWQIERLVPARAYVPENVTLACRTCATKRPKPAVAGRSLTARQQEPAADQLGGSTLNPPLDFDLLPPEASIEEGGRVHPEPPGRVHRGPPEGPNAGGGGSTLDPDPPIDPSVIRQKKEQGLRPDAAAADSRAPPFPLPVITKFAHEAYDLLGLEAEGTEVNETVKDLCARRHVPYRSDVVQKAIDSARWQRRHGDSTT